MAYIAQKPCSFAGQKFRVGEIIPESVLQPGAIKGLKQAGKIAETGAGNLQPVPASFEKEVTIPLVAKDSEVKMTVPQLIEAVTIAQMEHDDRLSMIGLVNREEQLMVIDAICKDEEVFEAAAKRAAELNPAEGEAVGHLDAEQLEAMPYNDLKKLAKEMNLDTTGTKEELIARIAAAEIMVPEEEKGEDKEGEQ